jgi:branched-chain amino acid transport system substrate-binding protein
VAPTCAHPLDPVAIGQVGFFSGFAAPITGSIRTMLAVWVKDINARGGLACHPVVLYSQDDGGDASRSAAAVQELVAVRRVVAFVANAPLAVAGFRYAVEAAKVPAIGGGDSRDWFESPWLFPQGASLQDQVVGVIRNGVAAGHKRLGVLYCVEATQCAEAITAVRDGAAKAAGAELVYDAAVSIAQTDYTAQCLNARDAHVDQLALGLDGASITRVARSCAAIGYRPLFSTSSGVLSPGQAADETLRSFGVATASGQVPFTLSDTAGLRSYREALARYAPNQAPDGASVIGWTCGKLLEAAVARVAEAARTGPITSALLMKGLGQIRDESLGGLTAPISYSPGQRHATSSGCVFYEFLSTTGWSAPRGSRPVCVRP